ncbi:MAG: PepSY-like domain-containing protein [Bacteroidota bacterium]|nr:MAG: PepSY-like domain-containing protein [Bacteroidota bacterium]
MEIESNKPIPEKILADTIYDIAHKNYPNNKIVGWEKTKLGQKVELDNDVELYFDDNGNFIRTEH